MVRAADRWGAKSTQEEKKLTPEQFFAAWQQVAAKVLRGDAVQTESGEYFVRCGRRLGGGKLCLHRLGHSASCSPNFERVRFAIAKRKTMRTYGGTQEQVHARVTEVMPMNHRTLFAKYPLGFTEYNH